MLRAAFVAKIECLQHRNHCKAETTARVREINRNAGILAHCSQRRQFKWTQVMM